MVIRGPLGVGKTTVAKRVARRLRGAYVSIDQILEAHDLWDVGALSEFLRANDVAVDCAAPFLRAGRPVIFDGNFYWKAQIEDLVGRLEFPYRIFTLAAPLAVCIERDAGRAAPHGAEAARKVYAKTIRFDCGTRVDANHPLSNVVENLLLRLENWVPRSSGRPPSYQ